MSVQGICPTEARLIVLGFNTPWWMVVLLGMGIVFAGLGLLVLLCDVLRLLFGRVKEGVPAAVPPAQAQGDDPIPERKRLIAAVSAAIAESEGTDISGIRVVSFRRRTQA